MSFRQVLVALALLFVYWVIAMLLWQKGHEMDNEDNIEAARAWAIIFGIFLYGGGYFIYRVIGL